MKFLKTLSVLAGHLIEGIIMNIRVPVTSLRSDTAETTVPDNNHNPSEIFEYVRVPIGNYIYLLIRRGANILSCIMWVRKMFKRIFKILSALAVFLSVPAAQAANTAPDLMPNLADGWAGLPSDVQKWILWILGTAFVLFVAVAILHTFGGSIKAILSGKRGDVAGRSSGISEAFMGVGVILVAVLAILLIIYVASSV